jgi:TIM-barrel protein
MAGITDGEFANKMISHGFDMVTIGGYNLDAPTIAAAKSIIKRGRLEFDFSAEEIVSHIESQVELIKDNHDVLVSANLRSTAIEPIIEVSSIKNLDFIEINAHCRQEEIMDVGCGQKLLKNPIFLGSILMEILKKSKSHVSVKIRANVPKVNTLRVSKLIDKLGADVLHVDAMKPSSPFADYELLEKIAKSTDIFTIGNNSIFSVEDGIKMANTGVDGISIARAAMHGIDFDLNKITTPPVPDYFYK